MNWHKMLQTELWRGLEVISWFVCPLRNFFFTYFLQVEQPQERAVVREHLLVEQAHDMSTRWRGHRRVWALGEVQVPWPWTISAPWLPSASRATTTTGWVWEAMTTTKLTPQWWTTCTTVRVRWRSADGTPPHPLRSYHHQRRLLVS